MKTGDCFILKGSTKDEPMTIYLIDQVRGESLDVYSIGISENMIHGCNYPDEYDNDGNIPSDAVFISKEVYYKVKDLMKFFVNESHNYIQENVITGDFVIEPKRYYYGRFIENVRKIEDNKVYYDTFRIEPENISPCWRGEANMDVLIDHWRPIPEYIYQEILRRYRKFIMELREYLFDF